MGKERDGMRRSTDKIERVWQFGSSMASQMVGGMAGLVTTSLTTNPFLGVAVGTGLAQTLQKVGADLIDAKLRSRQEIRVGRAIAVAAVRMNDRLSSGERVRDDAFMECDGNGRSDADEVAESALIAAMNSTEEKKVDFIAALITSIALDPCISAADGQQMIATAQILQYRAFVILRIANDVHAHRWPARGGEDVGGPPDGLFALMAQVYDMARLGLVEMRDSNDERFAYAVLGPDGVDPSKLHLTPLGKALYRNMELERLPEHDPTYSSTVADFAAISHCGTGQTRVDAYIDGGQI